MKMFEVIFSWLQGSCQENNIKLNHFKEVVILFNLKGKSVLKLMSILTVMLCVFMVIPALAGNGDGSGGEQKSPLVLESSDPAEGQDNISLSPRITLTFSKNVVNMKVKDENKECFVMNDAAGNLVPFAVEMSDDQTLEGREKRDDIVLIPQQTLESSTTYTVKISPNLQSKSGVSLGEEVTVTFTTLEAAKPVDNNSEQQVETPAPAEEKTVVEKNEPFEATIVEEEETPEEINGDQQEEDDTSDIQEKAAEESVADSADEVTEQGNNKGIVVAGIIVLAAIGGYFYFRRKK